MTYKINKTDGNLLAELPDGTFDNSSSSITLIGKNVTSFGEAINENFVKLLENFASTTQPEHAIKGQLWYDTSSGRINVYDGTSFRAAAGPLISPSQPTNLVSGDLWINNETNQLWFYDGTDLILAGPIYTNSQGTSGFVIESVLDNLNRSHTICKLYISNVLLGIFSKDEFTPRFELAGYGPVGTLIKIGFNISEYQGFKFNATATQAESLLDENGNVRYASTIAFIDQENTFENTVTIQNNNSLILGGAEQAHIKLVSDNLFLEHQISNKDISLRVKSGGVTKDGIYVKSTGQVGIFNSSPTYTLDVSGDLRVTGDLIVGGDSVTINTTQVVVEDKTLELGATASPTNLTADGGGILLRGTTSKTFTYHNLSGSWKSSENLNVASNRGYYINDVSVLNSTTLGSSVVNSSLTSLGNLTTLQMASGLNITQNTIQTTSGDLVLAASGNIDAYFNKISNVDEPTNDKDATTKLYVDNKVLSRALALSMDITGIDVGLLPGETLETRMEDILDKIAPYFNPVTAPYGVAINGTYLRVHATKVDFATQTVTRVNKLFIMTNNSWLFNSNIV